MGIIERYPVRDGKGLTEATLAEYMEKFGRGDLVLTVGSDRLGLVAKRILGPENVRMDAWVLEPDEWAILTADEWDARRADIKAMTDDGVDPDLARVDHAQMRVEEREQAERVAAIKEEGVREYLRDQPQITHFAPVDDPETASAPDEQGGWTFDATVAAAFDDMLSKSIPNYREMRDFCTNATEWVVDRDAVNPARRQGLPVVVDLGASRGSGLAPIIERLGDRARYRAYEISKPMLEELQERFKEDRRVQVRGHDLRDGAPLDTPTVVLSILTLQFVPVEYRQRLLREVYESLSPGGALILVEKVLGEAHETNQMLVDLYYGMKRGNGYTQEAIDRKRLALEGVLVPMTAAWNEELLRGAGFDLVESFWRYMNFAGWVAVKR
jgi:tRNA (cmo5U34)-methyltransferase